MLMLFISRMIFPPALEYWDKLFLLCYSQFVFLLSFIINKEYS